MIGVVARCQGVGSVAAAVLTAAHIEVLVLHQEEVGNVAAVAVAKAGTKAVESRIARLAGAQKLLLALWLMLGWVVCYKGELATVQRLRLLQSIDVPYPPFSGGAACHQLVFMPFGAPRDSRG